MKINILSTLIFLIVSVTNIFAQNNKRDLYGVFLDNSSSMNSYLKIIKEFGKEITKQKKDTGEIAIFNFQYVPTSKYQISELKCGFDWSQAQNNFNNYIDKITTVGGRRTTFLEVINQISSQITSKFEDEKGKFAEKVIILISDGRDITSEKKQSQMIKFLRQSQIKVFAIGLIDDLSESDMNFWGSYGEKHKAKYFFEKITKETKGRVIYPKSGQKMEDIVKKLFSENKKSD